MSKEIVTKIGNEKKVPFDVWRCVVMCEIVCGV